MQELFTLMFCMQNTLMVIECWSSWPHRCVWVQSVVKWNKFVTCLWEEHSCRYFCRVFQCSVTCKPSVRLIAYTDSHCLHFNHMKQLLQWWIVYK